MTYLSCALLTFISIGCAAQTIASRGYPDELALRKREFLTRAADAWIQAGCPVQRRHEEWKFDEIEPNWTGALATMRLKRSPSELAKANAFFEVMPVDRRVDLDMRVCEALHAYYLFRNDPNLSDGSRRRLLEIVHATPAPRRFNRSIWSFGATENHALMGHTWCLLVAQVDHDRETAARAGQHIGTFILEHIRKGWLEYNSPCYVEKDVGCLIMLAEWADDPLLRRKAELALDVLFAEHAALNLEGMLGGPACRVYSPGGDGILSEELGHNSRRDARCGGSYPLMWILFGQGEPHPYGVLGAPLLATSRYAPPRAVYALATSELGRGSYEFRARRPGHGLRAFRKDQSLDQPPPGAFNARVYAWVTPDYVLGSFQEVSGRYSALRSLPLGNVLRMKGSTRRVIYTELLPSGRREADMARVDCVQHRTVVIGRGAVGRAYFATREFDEVLEREGWLFARAGGTFAAYRVVGAGYSWERAGHRSLYGDFIRFAVPDAPFVMEAAQAADYRGDFSRFQADVMDNRVEQTGEGVSYRSCSLGYQGPSKQPFTLTLRYGDLPLIDGHPLDLEGYSTLDCPCLRSAWDSGLVELRCGGSSLTIDVRDPLSPKRQEDALDTFGTDR